MAEVYQLTFILSLGLLAVVVTVFVLAVSLLGRAIETTSNQQSSIMEKQKKTSVEQISKLESQLQAARTQGHLDEPSILEDLENSREKRQEYDDELRRIQGRLQRVRFKGAVIYPGSMFLGAIVLGILSTGLYSANNYVALSLWIISTILIAIGIYNVFFTIRAIESFTITSDEYSEKLPEAVKIALREIDEEKRPIPSVYFEDTTFPIHLQANSQIQLVSCIELVSGQYADDLEVHYGLQPGLTFKGTSAYTLAKGHHYEYYTFCKDIRPKILRGMTYRYSMTIKSSSVQGHFNMIYYVFCKGYWMEKATVLEVIVD